MEIEKNNNKLFFALIIFFLVIAGAAIVAIISYKGRLDNLQKQMDVLKGQTTSAGQNIPVAGKPNSANPAQPAAPSELYVLFGTIEKIENNILTVKTSDEGKEYHANIAAAEIFKREINADPQPKNGEMPVPFKDTKISSSDVRVNDTAVVQTVENLKGSSSKDCTAKRVIIQIKGE